MVDSSSPASSVMSSVCLHIKGMFPAESFAVSEDWLAPGRTVSPHLESVYKMFKAPEYISSNKKICMQYLNVESTASKDSRE